jgi:HEPN domain-containing protein
MSPAEDARLLLAIVQRHLRSLRFSLDAAYPEEDWGFTAQQTAEMLLKAWIVLADRQPPRMYDLADLAMLAEQAWPPVLLELQPFAVEARYEEGPFALPTSREQLLDLLERERQRCEEAVANALHEQDQTGGPARPG